MKVLYLVSRPLEINASSSVRNKATIQGLQEIGCEVQLVTTEPDKNHPSYDSSMTVKGIQTFYIQKGGIESVARLGNKLKFLMPLKKLAYQLLMRNNIYDNLVSAVNHLSELTLNLETVDYIISSSDPKSSHLIAQRLIELHPEFRGKWIEIWGDPFFGDISFENRQYTQIKKEEKKLISSADRVVYVSPLTLIKQQELYPDYASKMIYLPIPYVEKIISNQHDLKTIRPIEIAYCGDYYSNIRNIQPLYECVNQSPLYHLTICGATDLHLKQTSQVTIYPRVSRDQVARIENKADILVHLSNLKGTQIPGKIYQYAGTNKPILFILDGEKGMLCGLFDKYKRFYFTENDTPHISSCISTIIYGTTTGVLNIPIEDFSPQRIASRLVG